jgi:hypothetical protein
MKKLITLPILLFVLYLAGPVWAAWDLRAALKARDVPRLEALVDWAALRANLKPRLADAVRANADQSGVVGGAVKRALAGSVLDRTVDLTVTPATLARLLAGREFVLNRTAKASGPPPATADPDDPDDPVPPRRLRWAFFESLNVFRIEATNPRLPGGRLIARLGRDGLTWRLVDIEVPPS